MSDSNTINLPQGNTYQIEGVDVLSFDTLGASVSKSNLRQVGQLNSLTVVGNTELGQYVYFDANNNRVGINTSTPNGILSVVGESAEIVIGNPTDSLGTIGTFTSHDLALVTDNTSRILVKATGNVHVKKDLYVDGTLYATTAVYQTEVQSTKSVEFNSTADSTIYGIGLEWVGTGSPKQLVMRQSPDRLYTTENFDLAHGNNYFINGNIVLAESSLGAGVTTSSLTKLGALTELVVAGASDFQGSIVAQHITADTVAFNQLAINTTGIQATDNFNLKIENESVVYADATNVNIGDKNLGNTQMRVFGKLSVGVNNPDPDLTLAVAGNISFAGRKFFTGISFPIQGNYTKGDTCWNTEPDVGNFMGWVCVKSGNPGVWAGFGRIG